MGIGCASGQHTKGLDVVVHELRHVARLSWRLDSRASSFAFVRMFGVRYKELPPGRDAGDAEWAGPSDVRASRAATASASPRSHLARNSFPACRSLRV